MNDTERLDWLEKHPLKMPKWSGLWVIGPRTGWRVFVGRDGPVRAPTIREAIDQASATAD